MFTRNYVLSECDDSIVLSTVVQTASSTTSVLCCWKVNDGSTFVAEMVIDELKFIDVKI